MFEGLTDFVNVSNHLILIGIYCILALSLNLINGSLGVFSLGHHGFMAMGAYVAAAVVWMCSSPDGSLLVFFLSLAAGMSAAALFGLLVGAPCLRLKGDYLAIATLGFAEIFIIAVRNSDRWTFVERWRHSLGQGLEKWPGGRGLGGAAGFSIGEGYNGGNDAIYRLVGESNKGRQFIYLLLIWFLVALTFILIRNLLHSAHGRAVLAIREDETAAEMMGVRLIRYKVMVFVIGAALAGLAGALLANFRSTVSPDRFPMMEGIKILLMVVLGGLGSMSGTVIAVFVLYVAEQAIGSISTPVPFPGYINGSFVIVQKTIKDLWQVAFALLLIGLMLMRPNGILGRRELSAEVFNEFIKDWKRDPIPLVSTVVQWGQFAAALAFAGQRSWVLYLSIIVLVAIQIFKSGWIRRRKQAAKNLAKGVA